MTRIVICAVAGALVVVATAAGASHPRSDSQLAKALVVKLADQDVGPADRDWQARECLDRSGFAITARAHSPAFGTAHTLVDSAASVLNTVAEAKRYYRATVATISACLAQRWQQTGLPPWSVGPERPLGFPRYGDQSAARWSPITFSPAFGGFNKYTDDWVVIRKRRAVVADYFNFFVGWVSESGLYPVQEEQHVVRRQLARAFGP